MAGKGFLIMNAVADEMQKPKKGPYMDPKDAEQMEKGFQTSDPEAEEKGFWATKWENAKNAFKPVPAPKPKK